MHTQHELRLYRIYVANSLRTIAKNGGSYPTDYYYDLLHPKAKDNRTAEQIVADVIRKAKEGVE